MKRYPITINLIAGKCNVVVDRAFVTNTILFFIDGEEYVISYDEAREVADALLVAVIEGLRRSGHIHPRKGRRP